MTQAELGILYWIQNNIRCGVLDGALRFITELGNGGIFWILVSLIFVCFKETRRIGLAACIALALMHIFGNMVLKPLIERARPCDIDQTIEMIIGRPQGYSFPSGHTASSFAVVFAFYYAKDRLWKPAAVLAALIGFSRMYLFVHFPTDIIGGVLLGLVCGWLGAKAGRRLNRKISRCLRERRARKAAA